MSKFLLNDEDVAARIAADFIPVAGSIERLQPDRYGWEETPASRWFVPMAQEAFRQFAPAGFWEQFKSYQGLYIVGADGRPYGYRVVWELPPRALLESLDEAMVGFRKFPPAKVELDPADVAAVGAPVLDSTTSAVRVYSRVRPIPQDAGPANAGVGRDHLWIFADEVKEIVATAGGPGTRTALPARLAARLARFTLLDHVRNIGRPYDATAVSRALFHVTLRSRTDARYRFHLEGDFACERADPESGFDGKTGIEGAIEGELEIDSSTAKVVRWRAYGEGRAWGQTDTGPPAGKYPMVWAMVETADETAQVVPPIWYGLGPVWKAQYLRPTLAPGATVAK